MNKKLKILILILAIPCGLIIWFDQSRSFYCTPDNKCVTVWKRIGGKCYIIPGKYYNLLNLSGNYVETITNNDATIYWKKGYNRIIFRCEKDFKIINNQKNKPLIEDFNDSYEKNMEGFLYAKDAKRFSDVKYDVEYINLFILENYALGKNGKKI